MLSTTLIEQTVRKLSPNPTPEEALFLRTTAATQVNNALKVLAHRVAKESGYEGLQKDFSVTPTAGVIDLTALSAVIFDLHRSRVRLASDNTPVYAVDSMETLVHGGLPTDTPLYAQDGAELRFRDTSGVMGAYVTPVKIKSNWIPTLSELPSQYDAMLVETLAGLVGQVLSERRAREMAAVDSRA